MAVRREGKFNNAASKIENGVRRGLLLSGQLVAQRATRKAPRLTGRLKRSIIQGLPYASGPGRWAVDVGTNVEYARAQEFGSGLYGPKKQRYPIYPRRGKVLAFDWPNAPASLKYAGQLETTSTGMLVAKKGVAKARTKFVFAYVMHPGVPPHPYLRPALKESRGDARRLILVSVAGSLRSR